jgi:phosphatidylserine decarboxylase
VSKDPYISGWKFKKSREWSILLPAAILIIALVRIVFQSHWLTWIVLLISVLLLGLVLYFFRDPERINVRDPRKFYSPGDGVVSDITNQTYGGIEYKRIGIFLSVFDVHIQRVPIAGVVKFIEHQHGKNHPAFEPSASTENDQIIMGIQSIFGLVIVKQIAGILARRCVNYASNDERVLSGQRYGLIKFGSRVELYLPKEVEILCVTGEKAYGGVTALAEMKDG